MLLRAFDSQVGGTTASLEICVILVQLLNAYSPIALTLSPIYTFCRLVHSLKASLPIVVTLFGMVTEVSALHSAKANALIVVTLFGMFTEVRRLQFLYLQPIITQYFIDNKSEIWLLFLIAHSKR